MIKQMIILIISFSLSKDNEKLSNFLAKDLKDQFIGMNLKHKVRIIIRQINLDTFSNQILLEIISYLF